MVEPVPINRWANKAISGTLPGIFAGLLFNQYDEELQFSVGPLMWMKNLKDAINQNLIVKDTVKQQLYKAYGCETGGDSVDLGNQYRSYIEAFVDNVFVEIADRNG